MKVLKARVYDHFKNKAESEYAAGRRSLIGTGDRSERIRTYNYPQGRVTDHRINRTQYDLEDFLDGDLFEMTDALALADKNALLAQQ